MKKEFLFHRIEDPMVEDRERVSGAGLSGQDVTLPNLESLVGSAVIDPSGEEIGRLHCVWEDETHQASFLGIKTGWLGLGAIHVIPAEFAEYSQQSNRLRVPFAKDVIKDAPSYEEDDEMTLERQREVYNFYNTHGGRSGSFKAQPETLTGELKEAAGMKEGSRPFSARETQPSSEEARIRLHEEQLKVGKRNVEIGGVRLRKIIRTETVQQPVELKREELVVENVAPSETLQGAERAFEGEEIYIPLRAEEAVVEKQTRLKEEVRVRKEEKTEKSNIAENLRREELQTEKQGSVEETEHEPHRV